MKERWKKSVWWLANGLHMRRGKRFTAACDARAELGADLPPFWHLCEVREGSLVRGRGMHQDPQVAEIAALWSAGVLKPAPNHGDEQGNSRSMQRQLEVARDNDGLPDAPHSPVGGARAVAAEGKQPSHP